MNYDSLIDLLKCSECGSNRLYKDGLRYLSSGASVQRWLCTVCGYRFSEPIPQSLSHENVKQSLNTQDAIISNYQICALEAKNLDSATETKNVAGEISNNDVKGKIVDFSFWMLKEGYSKSTIKTRTKILQRLVRLQADIFNPESIKESIAKQQWSTGRKCIAMTHTLAFSKCRTSNGTHQS